MKVKKLDKNKKGIVLEDIDSKLDLIVEAQIGNNSSLGKLEEKVGDMKIEMNYKFEAVLEQLHIIRNEKINRDEFAALEKRVIAVERKLIGRK